MIRTDSFCELIQRQRASTFVRDHANTLDERVRAEDARVFRMRLNIQVFASFAGLQNEFRVGGLCAQQVS
jgi:hypothetical protein